MEARLKYNNNNNHKIIFRCSLHFVCSNFHAFRVLQERMKIEEEAPPKLSGGARWKSARADKGNVRSYGKEVVEKVKKKAADSENKGTAKTRRQARESENADFRSKRK